MNMPLKDALKKTLTGSRFPVFLLLYLSKCSCCLFLWWFIYNALENITIFIRTSVKLFASFNRTFVLLFWEVISPPCLINSCVRPEKLITNLMRHFSQIAAVRIASGFVCGNICWINNIPWASGARPRLTDGRGWSARNKPSGKARAGKGANGNSKTPSTYGNTETFNKCSIAH